MELHATDLITLQTYQELCHQNRAKSSVEHTRFFDIEDWQKLWQDFVAEFDKQVFTGKDGKVRSSQTNLANSKYSVWLHKESAGEVPHLHAAVCRLDEDGNINNDHNIHLRAQRAAERVAKKRG